MNIRKIESAQNPAIKEALKIREKRHLTMRLPRGRAPRNDTQIREFLIEGPRLLEMGADSGTEIRQIFVTDKFMSRHAGLLRRFASAEIFEVTGPVMDKLSETETPQGVVAIASYRPVALEDISRGGILVVCDGIQEPGNLGAIIRTADAAGAGGVIILPGTCDPFEGKALRASAGSIFNIPIMFEGRETVIVKLKRLGFRTAVTTPSSDGHRPLSLFDADLRLPVAFIFGNESKGVSAGLMESADLRLRLPITGRAESLNVAASAAVCLYEALRQRLGS